METCPSCGGNGKCKWCSPKGSGKNSDGTTCKVCKGTGTCNEQTSSGYRCGGSGKVTKI